MFKNSVWKMHL